MRRLLLIVVLCIICIGAGRRVVVVMPSAAVGAPTPPFSEDFNTAGTGDPTSNGHWTFDGTWVGGGTTLTSSSETDTVAIFTYGTTTTGDMCVCADVGNAANLWGLGLRMGATVGSVGGSNEHFVVGVFNDLWYVWEYDADNWQRDPIRAGNSHSGFGSGDRVCVGVSGAASTSAFKLWFYNTGGGTGYSCTDQTGDWTICSSGCDETWISADGFSGGVSANNNHCGVGTQDPSLVYDNWTCDDYP